MKNSYRLILLSLMPVPLLGACDLPFVGGDDETHCVEASSSDVVENNMLCTRSDGTTFYTDAEGAEEYTTD